MESLYYVRKTLGDRVVTAGFERIEGLGWCWLMDYVCSNGCSVMDYRGHAIFERHGLVVENGKHEVVFRSATYDGVS